jgi:PAS domain S-box-containing protein
MIFLNEAGSRMLGISPAEVEQFNIMQVIPAHLKEKVETELLPALMGVGTWAGDLQYLNLKTGRLTDVHAMTFVIRDPATGAPLHLANVSLDITDRKRAEEEIRRKAKDLQDKNEELARFTYAVSHDLRSPLVTIQTFQGYLEQDVRSQDAARIEKDLGYIRNAADKMGLLLNELLRLSRVGRVTTPPEEAPLQSLVKEALDLVAGRLTARGVQVEVTEEPVMLTGDRTRLVEVFQNLVDNATKFMGDEPAPRVEIGVEQAGEELVLFVRDNGIGIEPQLQPLVFGLFRKLDPGTEGAGLGLALVRRIVELHGGRVWVESEGLGKGTTFRLTLAQTTRKRD